MLEHRYSTRILQIDDKVLDVLSIRTTESGHYQVMFAYAMNVFDINTFGVSIYFNDIQCHNTVLLYVSVRACDVRACDVRARRRENLNSHYQFTKLTHSLTHSLTLYHLNNSEHSLISLTRNKKRPRIRTHSNSGTNLRQILSDLRGVTIY